MKKIAQSIIGFLAGIVIIPLVLVPYLAVLGLLALCEMLGTAWRALKW